MLRARTGWTRAQQVRVWAATAAAALVVGCSGGGGIAGTGRGALEHVSRLGHGHGWARARTRARH